MTQEIPAENPRRAVEPLAVEPAAVSPVRAGPLRAGLGLRVFSFICAGAVTVVIGIVARLEPDPRGYGTHEKWTGQPCGFKFTTGMPCPTCGVTTTFVEMAHFRPLEALVHQPFGVALFLLVLAAGVGWLYTAVTGRRWPLFIGFFLRSPRFLYGMLALFLCSWGYLLLMTWLQMHGSTAAS